MDIEKLYDEAFSVLHVERILFRGFLLEKVNGVATIKDISTTYYKEVNKESLDILISKGFIKGSTYLLMLSDLRKIDMYKKLIERYQNIDDSSLRISRYEQEINYYKSQVSRWRNLILQ